eukprot:3958008-Pyramimonas_sp.AAC.1
MSKGPRLPDNRETAARPRNMTSQRHLRSNNFRKSPSTVAPTPATADDGPGDRQEVQFWGPRH